mgnify:CR=1 FL=1
MTQIDINGNTISKNRGKLIKQIKSLNPCKYEVQAWGRIRVYGSGIITFFADEEPKITGWIIENGLEL